MSAERDVGRQGPRVIRRSFSSEVVIHALGAEESECGFWAFSSVFFVGRSEAAATAAARVRKSRRLFKINLPSCFAHIVQMRLDKRFACKYTVLDCGLASGNHRGRKVI